MSHSTSQIKRSSRLNSCINYKGVIVKKSDTTFNRKYKYRLTIPANQVGMSFFYLYFYLFFGFWRYNATLSLNLRLCSELDKFIGIVPEKKLRTASEITKLTKVKAIHHYLYNI